MKKQAKKQAPTMIRQGDVLIRYIDPANVPTGPRTKIAPVDGRIILAEGEATGHAHTVVAVYATLYAIGAARILEIQRETMLEHQEHTAQPLPEGVAEVLSQREYDQEMIRRVAD